MGIFNVPYLGNIIAMVIMLGVLIIIHELGHFVTAKLFGVKVKTFSVGFGKKLFGFQRGETEYRVSMIPLGGYVALLGEEDPEEAESDDPGNFNNKPRWQRFIILAMGATLNIVLAFMLFTVVNMFHRAEPLWRTSVPVVGWVDASSPAFVADLQTGDRIVSFDGKRINTWDQFQLLVVTNPDKDVDLVVEREGKLLTLEPELIAKGRDDAGYLGAFPLEQVRIQSVRDGSPAAEAGLQTGDVVIKVGNKRITRGIDQFITEIQNSTERELELLVLRSGTEMNLTVSPEGDPGSRIIGAMVEVPYRLVKLSFGNAVIQAGKDVKRFTALTFTVLGKLLRGELSLKSISGPVDIARISGEAARTGVISFVYIMGLISLQLGIFNLLPIPMLDGGLITILGIEAIRRKDLSIKMKERITTVGFVLLVTLMVVVIISDVLKNLGS